MKSLWALGISAALIVSGLSGCATNRSADQNLAKNVTAAPTAKDYCIKETGTRIKPKEGECVGAAGRTYSRDELDRTGAFSAAEALRKLDPAL
jgi:hypothetical protein